MTEPITLSHEEYTVGWICALPAELAAAEAMLDEEHDTPRQRDNDQNTYSFGRIGVHNVVMTCLPAGITGVTSAANVAIQMQNTFNRLRFGLMVGVGGGVPSEEVDIRLGDIVVSQPTAIHGGVVQYDLGKTTQEGRFLRTGALNKPPEVLLTALSKLQAKHLRKGFAFTDCLSAVFERYPAMACKFDRPGESSDVLYKHDYDHPEGNSSCLECDFDKRVCRNTRTGQPSVVHYGLIASGNQVMRHGATRERLRQDLGVMCIEMEAAGLMDRFPCLVIRGICDYSDSHKHKTWQNYAALMAACYARELLSITPGSQVTETRSIAEAIGYSERSSLERDISRTPPALSQIQLAAPPGSQFEHQVHDSGKQRTSSDQSLFSASNQRCAAGTLNTSTNAQARAGQGPRGEPSSLPGAVSVPVVHSAFHEDREPSAAEKEFQHCLRNFKSKLSPQQRLNFKKVTLKDLRMSLLRIEREQAEKSRSMNLPRVEMFLKRLGQLVEISAFVDMPEYCCLVWGSIKFILQITAALPDAFDTVLRAYEPITDAITFGEEDLAWLADCDQKNDISAKVYDSILHFHVRLLSLLSIPSWRQVFSSVWRALADRLRHISRDIGRYQDLIRKRATYADICLYNEQRLLDLKSLEKSESRDMRAQLADILQWLSGINIYQDHESICKVREDFPDTGQWFLKHPQFVRWRRDSLPKLPLFWLRGIPGAGKTVLASAVIDDCEKDRKARTAYFYCKHGDIQRTTLVPVLKTILNQLISTDHRLLPWCYDQYSGSNQLSLSSEKTCKAMLRMMLLNTERVFIIIDGIDECEEYDRKLLLSFLTGVITECDLQDHGKLRVLITSRNEPDIRSSLGECSEMTIKPENSESDMKKFINVWRQKISTRFDELEEADLDYICNSTFDRADGMFLFARLVMTNLHQQVGLQHLQQQILPENFPEGIEQAYERIVERIGNNDDRNTVAVARKVLALMTFARRPLKWHEIQAALSIEFDGTINFAQRRARTHIRDICGSLVTDLSGDRLELVHSTARDYLVHCSFVEPRTTECSLASLCLNYLTFECFDQDIGQARRKDFLLQGYYAFQDYAVTHWSDHISAVIKAGPATTASDEQAAVGSAVSNFVAHYRLYLQTGEGLGKNDSHCSLFAEQPYFDDTCHLFEYINRQRKQGLHGMDEVNPKPLDGAVNASRTMLEEYARSASVDLSIQQDLVTKYGAKWYKCPKATCYYFHEGFGDLRSKTHHVARHEQPFRCRYTDCETGYKLGFTTPKNLEKHMMTHHPEQGTFILATFARLKRGRDKDETPDSQSPSRAHSPANFACNLCEKRYTRLTTLRSHMLTHVNERPFKCSQCEQTFTRNNDRQRHESTTHTAVKKFVCHGQLKYGVPGHNTWGCGRAFPRADALRIHYNSEGGKACRKPLYEEQERERQWHAQIEERRAQGLELPPLPEVSSHLGPAPPHKTYLEGQNSNAGTSQMSVDQQDDDGLDSSQEKAWRPFRASHSVDSFDSSRSGLLPSRLQDETLSRRRQSSK